jgi:hypothetical protein
VSGNDVSGSIREIYHAKNEKHYKNSYNLKLTVLLRKCSIVEIQILLTFVFVTVLLLPAQADLQLTQEGI